MAAKRLSKFFALPSQFLHTKCRIASVHSDRRAEHPQIRFRIRALQGSEMKLTNEEYAFRQE